MFILKSFLCSIIHLENNESKAYQATTKDVGGLHHNLEMGGFGFETTRNSESFSLFACGQSLHPSEDIKLALSCNDRFFSIAFVRSNLFPCTSFKSGKIKG